MRHKNPARAEEMEFTIALWQESGLSQYAFCKREGLARSTFQYWAKKFNGDKPIPKSKAKKFLSVNLSGPSNSRMLTPISAGLEIHFPNGVKVCCPTGFSQEGLERLIHLY
ncbi:MAG: hypothetical protein HRT57_14750 [Crocinitomicaceae bacterium]|nr:hypothetical protein [Crocinitomicaceae bacterium]